ncbi:hypothetical protein ECBCE011MS01_1821 [Escherichia coli BCE011_MS-01]|nr:hypothetical protein ECBCE011MS01_1821 [Escherichia coli BCE011_MS-01]
MGFHLAAHPVEIAVNCGIAAPGVKPDGLPFGLIFNFLPVTGMCCQRKQL